MKTNSLLIAMILFLSGCGNFVLTNECSLKVRNLEKFFSSKDWDIVRSLSDDIIRDCNAKVYPQIYYISGRANVELYHKMKETAPKFAEELRTDGANRFKKYLETGNDMFRSSALIQLGGYYLHLDDDDKDKGKALKYTDMAIKIGEHEARAWRLRGNILLEIDNYNEAIDSFNKSLEYDNYNTWTWTGLGTAYALNKNWKKSIENYERALRYDKNNEIARENMAWAIKQLK